MTREVLQPQQATLAPGVLAFAAGMAFAALSFVAERAVVRGFRAAR